MKRLLGEIKYSFYLTVHPFKGFWEIKHENQGSLKTAFILLAFFILTSVANGYYGGYIFNSGGGVNFNAYKQVAMILLIWFIWGVANWCLTSLFDGEGTFSDICKFTSYALLPMSLVQMLMIPLSLALSMKEAAFYTMVMNIGLVWTGALIFIGLVVTHQYTVLKSILITAITIFAMGIIIYIMLLYLNLLQQIAGFAITFIKEMSLRVSS
ncbi:MAG: YIP1 family protein [Oscillospiraceae bacterium]|jgi:hypothetical protein|nr:YIP1 family protein [Oscillospiraceae bacterium]